MSDREQSSGRTSPTTRRGRSGAAASRCARRPPSGSPQGRTTEDEKLFASRAAERPAFLETDTWRALRILSEFVEGFEALAEVGPGGDRVRVGAGPGGEPRRTSSRATIGGGAREGRVRGHHRRRPGRDGGRQPRRPRGRRDVDRLQHRAAARAAPQPVRRRVGRVPLLLRPQDDVREVLRRVRDHARRLRHARRAVRGADADPDRQDPPLPGGADGARLLGRAARLDARRRSSRRARSAQDDIDLLRVTDDPERGRRDHRRVRPRQRDRRRGSGRGRRPRSRRRRPGPGSSGSGGRGSGGGPRPSCRAGRASPRGRAATRRARSGRRATGRRSSASGRDRRSRGRTGRSGAGRRRRSRRARRSRAGPTCAGSGRRRRRCRGRCGRAGRRGRRT